MDKFIDKYGSRHYIFYDKNKFLTHQKTFDKLQTLSLLKGNKKLSINHGDRLILSIEEKVKLLNWLVNDNRETLYIRCKDGCCVMSFDRYDDVIEICQYLCFYNRKYDKHYTDFVDLNKEQVLELIQVLEEQ